MVFVPPSPLFFGGGGSGSLMLIFCIEYIDISQYVNLGDPLVHRNFF